MDFGIAILEACGIRNIDLASSSMVMVQVMEGWAPLSHPKQWCKKFMETIFGRASSSPFCPLRELRLEECPGVSSGDLLLIQICDRFHGAGRFEKSAPSVINRIAHFRGEGVVLNG